MCRQAPRFVALIVLQASALLTTTAAAQQFLEDRTLLRGPGFLAGRLEVHPGAGTDVGYTTNAFSNNGRRFATGTLRSHMFIDVSTLTAPRIESSGGDKATEPRISFLGGGSLTYSKYLNDSPAFDFSSVARLAASGYFDLTYHVSPVFAVQIHDNLNRTTEPFAAYSSESSSGRPFSYASTQNTGGIELRLSSRSKVLSGLVDYSIKNSDFDSPIFSYARSVAHQGSFLLNWAFLPSTALFYNLTTSAIDYRHGRNNSQVPAPTQVADGVTAQNVLGVNGSISERLSLTLAGGYTFGVFRRADDFDLLSVRAETRWTPRPTVAVTSGFTRAGVASILGTFTTSNRVSVNVRMLLKNVVTVGLNTLLDVRHTGRAFQPIRVDNPQTATTGADGRLRRHDVLLKGTIFTEYRATTWLTLSAETSLLGDMTDWRYNPNAFPTNPNVQPPDAAGRYFAFQLWTGVYVHY